MAMKNPPFIDMSLQEQPVVDFSNFDDPGGYFFWLNVHSPYLLWFIQHLRRSPAGLGGLPVG